MDVWGPYKVATYNGMKFFLTLVDDYTRWTWTFLIRLKSDVIFILKNFLVMVKTQFGKSVKMFRSDNGSEFFNTQCSELFQLHEILHQSSCPYTPQQNGVVERRHRHILEIARAIRFQGHLPARFWGDCIETAEGTDQSFLDYLNMRTLYDHSTPDHEYYPHSTSTPARDSPIVPIPESSPVLNSDHGHSETSPTHSISTSIPPTSNPPTSMPTAVPKLSIPPIEVARKSSRTSKPPIWLKDYVTADKGTQSNSCRYPITAVIGYDQLSPKYQSYLSRFSSEQEPNSYYEAAKDKRWIEAIQTEIKALEDNKTWEIVPLPHEKRAIGFK
ncbi:uncharacterized protein LOC142182334 [Nicotiana tabacum]|uniref:Uncharacterized protein LOC142182334 n=1 Tax=Nicotiana tabacum TaxID=4097 RepID=A0AC58UT74_TOBAC